MLFYSFEFLYVFLPITLFGFYFLYESSSPRLSIYYLVGASLLFYGWWNYKYVALIVASIVFNYFAGVYLQEHKKRVIAGFAVVLNLALLGYCKYANFFIESINQVLGLDISSTSIVLPLAISFFTFQQIAWICDSYTSKVPKGATNFWDYCLFVLFFPQLIAGPIVHHKEMMPQFLRLNPQENLASNISVGLAIFIIGLAKKVLVADSLAPISNSMFDAAAAGAAPSLADAWIGALGYTGQLYFDFSGYADMAIGLALMFGIRLPLNFNSPYKSTSIAEFWRRWHMTLSRFLRDYIYIPLGGNRQGEIRRLQNLMITMLIGGLWHGANWTFVFWGFLHGAYLVLHRFWEQHSPLKLPIGISWAITFLSVVLAWVFFRAESFDTALTILHSMFGLGSARAWESDASLLQMATVVLALLVSILLPNTQQLMSEKFRPIEIYEDNKGQIRDAGYSSLEAIKLKWRIPSQIYLFCLATASVISLLDATTVNEFIYFQF